MLCPNCRLSMRVVPGSDPKTNEYFCGGCGLRLSTAKNNPQAIQKDYFIPVDAEEKNEKARLNASISAARKRKNRTTSPSRAKKRKAKAERATELRRISNELNARIKDFEIQFERRLEELQRLAVKLSQMMEDDKS